MPAAITSSIEPSVIAEQLKRVLASPHFAETTRMKRFLSHLVNEALAGRSDELKGYALGVDVFDKPDDFDPGLDTIVRVQANKLRVRLDLYYSHEGREDPVRIHVPKGSYAPVFEIAFDPKAQDAPATSAPKGKKRASLAVMPFDNLSGDPGQEFMASGLTEELIAAIARFREVSVLSRHVTYRYSGRARDPRDVGRELDVSYLVEGSIRHWDGNLRVVAQLVDADSGEQVFAETYDRDLSAENLFAVQEDVAARIATEIADPHGVVHRTGSAERKAGTRAFDAYQCRLLATEYWRHPTATQHARVRELLERAVQIDPDYAGAWGMLAIVYGDEVRGGFNVRSDPPAMVRALEAAERSVKLDPFNATGQHALFLTRFHLGEFEGYRDAADKALKANPNYADMLADLSVCEGLRGDVQQGLALNARAIELCPDPPGWYHAGTCLLHFRLEDYDTALAAARRIGNGMWNGSEALVLMCLGHLVETEDSSDIAELVARFHGKVPHPDEYIGSLLGTWQVPEDLAKRIEAGLKAVGAI
ncbi:MAG: hypothetical protein AAFU82_14535 [Pseudomonadota bacterium]